jgi:DNA invertase Pin-like site-specific DNA recombinase
VLRYATLSTIMPNAMKNDKLILSHWKANLSPELIPVIFEMRKAGATLQKIADVFLVHRSTISRILRRQSWKHIKVPSIIQKAP